MRSRRGRRGGGWVVGALVAVPTLGACGDDEDPARPPGCAPELERVELEAFGRQPIPQVGGGLVVRVSAVNGCGDTVPVPATQWSTSDPSVVTARPFIIITGDDVEEDPDEGFVSARGFGTAQVRAEVSGVVATLGVEVVRPPTRAQGLSLLGADSVSRRTTDLWVHGDYAYSGTGGLECDPPTALCPDAPGLLVVWRVGNGGVPIAVDSVPLPGPHTNDVKVAPGGGYLVVSQEHDAADNGIVVLDLADPAAPAVVAHFTAGLEQGVHNLWLETIDGTDYAFVVEAGGGPQSGLHVLDLSDPAAPVRVTRWQGGDSQIHDVYVRDGLAFVSHWDDGLFIVDVGNGIAGGSPAEPVVVGSLVMDGGNTHNAWYWPDGGLVFVGEERGAFPEDTMDVGRLHVVDVSDLSAPVEVADYVIPGETPHNFWLDEENQVLYAAWYSRGVRALDVSGTLSGDLAGREIGFLEPSGSEGLASVWAPQLHRGVLYLSDQIHGLWAARPIR